MAQVVDTKNTQGQESPLTQEGESLVRTLGAALNRGSLRESVRGSTPTSPWQLRAAQLGSEALDSGQPQQGPQQGGGTLSDLRPNKPAQEASPAQGPVRTIYNKKEALEEAKLASEQAVGYIDALKELEKARRASNDPLRKLAGALQIGQLLGSLGNLGNLGNLQGLEGLAALSGAFQKYGEDGKALLDAYKTAFGKGSALDGNHTIRLLTDINRMMGEAHNLVNNGVSDGQTNEHTNRLGQIAAQVNAGLEGIAKAIEEGKPVDNRSMAKLMSAYADLREQLGGTAGAQQFEQKRLDEMRNSLIDKKGEPTKELKALLDGGSLSISEKERINALLAAVKAETDPFKRDTAVLRLYAATLEAKGAS